MRIPVFSHAGFHTTGTVPYHKHSGCEIILVTRGTCRVYTGSGFFEAGKNDVIVIPPETEHNQVDGPDVENYYCVFQAEEALFPSGWRLLRQVGTERTETLFRELYRMTWDGDPVGAEGVAYALLRRLALREEEHSGDPPELKTVMRLIRERCRTPLTIQELAEHSGMSAGHLRALFRRHRNESPLEYLNGLRLALARNLLADPQLSIKEIADNCGIPDVNYFIRFYKKHFGTTPGNDRRQIKNKDSAS